jgi:hypothetical protein
VEGERKDGAGRNFGIDLAIIVQTEKWTCAESESGVGIEALSDVVVNG